MIYLEAYSKQIAEKTLKYLCMGSQVEGIKFYGTQLLFSESKTNNNRIDGQIYLKIEGRFNIYFNTDFEVPNDESELPEYEWIEASKLLCELRLKTVIDIKLGEQIPHLYIYFESGEVLLVYGHHPKYETWQLGVLNNTNKEVWEVVACPGDNIATWVPKDLL